MRLYLPAAALLFSYCVPGLCGEIAPVPLRNDRAYVEKKYEELSKLQVVGRRHAVASLSFTMQEDVWTVHFERYLREHPELTADQQAVILDGIGLLAVGVIEKHHADDATAKEADLELLRQLQARAIGVFSPEEAAAIFARMGGSGTAQSAPASGPFFGSNCTCHIGGTDCGDDTCVRFAPPNGCTPTPYNCGIFNLQSCDGNCI